MKVPAEDRIEKEAARYGVNIENGEEDKEGVFDSAWFDVSKRRYVSR